MSQCEIEDADHTVKRFILWFKHKVRRTGLYWEERKGKDGKRSRQIKEVQSQEEQDKGTRQKMKTKPMCLQD